MGRSRTNRSKYFNAVSLSAVATAALLSIGCEKEEERKVYSAQTCLDNARTEADADMCVSMVEGLESQESYLIRCSAHFIAQGFTGQRAAQAFQGLKDKNSGGQDPMATAMAYMVFPKESPIHSVDQTVTDCTRSGVNSMVQLATMAKLATFVAQTASGLTDLTGGAFDPESGSFDQSKIDDAIQHLIDNPDPATNATVGDLALTANASFCGEGSPHKDTEICTNLAEAIANGGGDVEAIGAKLLEQLRTNNN